MIQNMSLVGLAAETKAEFAYSGAYTLKQITSGGVTYDLYTLTGSGTLTVTGTAKNAAIWGCGGGANGGSGYGGMTSAGGGYGGGGGYAADYLGDIADGAYVVTVAAAGGATSVGSLLSANGASSRDGGSGGGGNGKGDGKSKYPFDDTVNFEPHCAGGGGGEWREKDTNFEYTSGYVGTGGTNGSKGKRGDGNTGGVKGGGNGGYYYQAGKSATFYGSGGGGGGGEADAYEGGQGYSGGSGYQGVVYIRVPV